MITPSPSPCRHQATSLSRSICLATATALMLATFWPRVARAQDKTADSSRDSRLDWWRQARFGLFIHWGPVSLEGTEISWSRKGERRELHQTPADGIPVAEYDALYHRFNPTNFSAAEWVAVAQAAGMKYLVFTAKHHDGFCEFDSKLTDYKITRAPFGRDVCAELADACHRARMRLGFYYSPPDWHHPDYLTANHQRYLDYFFGQARELLTDYKPVDILWFDSAGGDNTPELWDAPRLMAMIHQVAPNVIMTRRCGGLGDFDTPEQHVGAYRTEPWETCMTLCNQWAWKPDDRMKSLQQCVQILVQCAGGDGNLLLNVGPMPDGRIEPRQVARLKEIGAWLAENGESIYGTRGGPWKPAKSLASTRAGDTVYLHVLRWSGDSVELPAPGRKVKSAAVLGGGIAETAEKDGELIVRVAPSFRRAIDTVIKMQLDGSAMNLPVMDVGPLANKD